MAKSGKLVIVFVRHAHRDTSERSSDNGLSEKGHKQVTELVKTYENGDLPEGATFWTSPKLRCKETLGPIAKAAGQQTRIEAMLDEQHGDETHEKFRKRIRDLIAKAEKAPSPVYLCSHGDFIPEAISVMAGVHKDLSKGEAVILEKTDDWRII